MRDIQRALGHLGIESYATFGYSVGGAMAARLAVADKRATAVACGGFPLTADLAGIGRRQRERTADAHDDPAAWAELIATYDPDAAVAFWDDVASLPRARLADPGCPVRAWWGGDDTVLGSLIEPVELGKDLAIRSIEYDVVPGLGHDSMLDCLGAVLPAIASWLSHQVAGSG